MPAAFILPKNATRYPDGTNWAEALLAEWLAYRGGTDITGEFGDDDDYGTWVGDVIGDDGAPYRIRAEPDLYGDGVILWAAPIPSDV